MNSLSGIDCRIYGGNKFNKIKNEQGNDVGDEFIVDGLGAKENRYSPPKAKTIDQQ